MTQRTMFTHLQRMNLRRIQVLVKHLRMSSSSSSEPDVLLETINGKGVITLNRPKALNSLNLSMIRKIYPQLKEWDADSSTSLVIIKGAGEKAFCAGGDIKAVTDAGRVGDKYSADFFREEYILNHKIGTMKKPYIALVHGISMGGGVGLSIHGKYRVATEKTLFAMPETGIGLFPDVGGGYALPRMQGQLGIFLALTGFRLRGRDVQLSGYATHFVESSQVKDLEQTLLNMKDPSATDIDEVINTFHEKCQLDKDKPFVLQPHQEQINRLFAGETMEDICEALKKDGSEWAVKQLEIIRKMSPTSLKVSLRVMREGAKLSLPADLKMEYRVSQGCIRGKDFYEGVRALLVDKDGNPKWNPATLEEVTSEIVDEHFQPLDNDLEL
ncbi:3-hydroxyisobutyryl-CoA hydrolase, mitochondrial [Holothuria leucospilota]|uniref:3-hydroxyisobutyryl-CoA hydrolase, mitochondrial n=1 Tax=Holothuria leucospilota TaxID=206669 RepID=A0A9Q1H5W9_HOLLE|nr:3-hydroxyisobutyryl-CoA hydrolase, mitochondrial [Holothuria leucospilota]